MLTCTHQNIDVESHPVMAGNGYHDCEFLACSDCDSIYPTGDCDNETCDNY